MKKLRHSTTLRNLAIATLALPAMAMAGPGPSNAKILPMDQVGWAFNGDRFSCEAVLNAQPHGTIKIVQVAGNELTVTFAPTLDSSGLTKATWVSAPWGEPGMGRQSVMQGDNSEFSLSKSDSLEFVRSLDDGTWTWISHANETVIVPSINWSDASQGLRECRQKLSPLTIEDARDQDFFYRAGQRSLSRGQLERIDDLAAYIKIDSKVTRILVDSYTDLSGTRLGNLQISRERTADVVSALKERGISSDLIEGRAHGERLTAPGNYIINGVNTARKVTIRIVREDEVLSSKERLEPILKEIDLPFANDAQAREAEMQISSDKKGRIN